VSSARDLIWSAQVHRSNAAVVAGALPTGGPKQHAPGLAATGRQGDVA
jgi:hypothetical protein